MLLYLARRAMTFLPGIRKVSTRAGKNFRRKYGDAVNCWNPLDKGALARSARSDEDNPVIAHAGDFDCALTMFLTFYILKIHIKYPPLLKHLFVWLL